MMGDGLTEADLDEILRHRDERVRAIFREEIQHSIGNGVGHAIRKAINLAMLKHEEDMRQHMADHAWMFRVLRGDPDGLDAGAVATLREHREMVARIKTISLMVKVIVPLFALDLLTRFVPIVDLLSNP